MTTATEAWAAVVGCPAEALIGQYQVRPPGKEGMGYAHLESPQCRIIDTHRSMWFDTITSEVFEGVVDEEVSLEGGVEAVRLLNAGASMPLSLSQLYEDLLWDETFGEET